MFIELVEMLKCPARHEEGFLVVATAAMAGRSVRRGVVGCPVCRAEYSIVDGTVHFGSPPERPEARVAAPVDALHALLGLEGPGGYVVLVGAVAQRADEMTSRLEGVHFVGVNAPSGVAERPHLSLLVADGGLPLRSSMARGVVVGEDFADDPWLAEAARITLTGRHVIVEREGVDVPGTSALGSGSGLWVGERC